jgi:hypothetical protein
MADDAINGTSICDERPRAFSKSPSRNGWASLTHRLEERETRECASRMD